MIALLGLKHVVGEAGGLFIQSAPNIVYKEPFYETTQGLIPQEQKFCLAPPSFAKLQKTMLKQQVSVDVLLVPFYQRSSHYIAV